MDPQLQVFADLSIRRACAFTGLATMTVMIALSYDASLALRTGAEFLAMLVMGLTLSGYRAPRRNLRHSEIYVMLREAGVHRQRLASAEMQVRMADILRERAFWHAERVGYIALALWFAALLSWLFSSATH
jgi:hypothetical protein